MRYNVTISKRVCSVVFIGLQRYLTIFCISGLLLVAKVHARLEKEAVIPDLSFIENKGQWISEIKYKAELKGGAMFLTEQGFVYHFESEVDRMHLQALTCSAIEKGGQQADVGKEVIRYHAYKVSFVGARKPLATTTGNKRSYYHNYFIGNRQDQWAGKVGLFEKVMQQNIYDGIDVVLYSQGINLKYDFVVAAGADPNQVALRFEGVIPQLTEDGNLKITTSVNEIVEQAPYVYQWIDDKEVKVASRYRFVKGILSYELLEGYNKQYPLIIDPTLVFSTYSGSTGSSHLSYSTTYDRNGNLYPGAYASLIGWPTTFGAYQMTGAGNIDVGINKYNASGTALLYSTYYGGRGNDVANAMITNEQEELIIAGITVSSDLPYTSGCYDSTINGGQDFFVVRFNKEGSAILGATFVGGSGNEAGSANFQVTMSPLEVALDSTGNIWVASNTGSSNFPVTNNAYQATRSGRIDGILFELNPDCSRLLYSTYLGGSDNDACYNVVLNHAGNVVVCGATGSRDFPVTTGVLHPVAPGSENGFVSIINAQTGALLQSTYIGTDSIDQTYRLQVDELDNIYVLGMTKGNYPISAGVYHISGSDLFIDKLSPTLSQSLQTTRMGNAQQNNRFIPSAFLYDVCGHIYVSGFSAEEGLPTTPDAYQTKRGGFWFCVLTPGFSGLHYASYFGDGHSHDGVHRFDPEGIVYQSICSSSGTFPITDNAVFPKKLNSGLDNLSFKFNFESSIARSRFDLASGLNDSGCVPYTVSFLNTSISSETFTWNFGDGSPASHDMNVIHTFTQPGKYRVALSVHNDSSCNKNDTSYLTIEVFKVTLPDITVRDTVICVFTTATDLSVQINNQGLNQRIQWMPSTGLLTAPDQAKITVDPTVNRSYYVIVTDSIPHICNFSTTDTVHIDLAPRLLDILTEDTMVCQGTVLSIQTLVTPGYRYRWTPGVGLSDSTLSEPQLTVGSAQVYTLTASYTGCPDTSAMIKIGMQQYPMVALGPDRVACQWSEVALKSEISPYRNDYAFQWTPVTSGLQFPDRPNAILTADSTVTYTLKVQTPIGCTGMDSVKVTVIAGDFGSVIADTGYCPPDSVLLWANGGSSYWWTPSYGLSDTAQQSPIAKPLTSTNYTVYIQEEHNCRDTLQVMIDVWPLAIINLPDSIHLYPGERYHLEPGTNCLYFQWFPSSGMSHTGVSDPWFSPEVRTRYFVTATTEQGCTIKDSMNVLVHCTVMDMPNAFAPGGGHDNTFKVARRGIAQLRRFVIFNRWGNLLFETTNWEGWDGTYKGEPQPLGVYVYQVEATTDCGKPYFKEGNVTLLR